MATIASSGSGGNWNSGGTWTGGSVPGDADEAHIDSGDTVTLTANAQCGNVMIDGGTLVGGGYKITCVKPSGRLFDHSGTISGVLDVELQGTHNTTEDFDGTGNVRNLTLNGSGLNVSTGRETELDGDLIITQGTLTTGNYGFTCKEANITGTLDGSGTGSHQFANMEINNNGTYLAPSGTTTITASSGGSTSGRAYWSHTGGTMRHNFGTFSVASGAQVEPGGPADAGAGGMDAHSFWNLTSAGSLLPKTQRFVVCNDLETNGDIGYNGNAYWMEIYGTWTHKSGGTNNSDTAHSNRGYGRIMVLQGGQLDVEKMNWSFGSFRSIGNGIVQGGTDSG